MSDPCRQVTKHKIAKIQESELEETLDKLSEDDWTIQGVSELEGGDDAIPGSKQVEVFATKLVCGCKVSRRRAA